MRRYVIAAILVAVAATAPSANAQKLKIGDTAPKLTVTEWLKGAPQTLAAGRGKNIYVLDFWATWCLPCLQTMPSLSAMQTKYKDNGVVLIGVTGPVKGQQLSAVKRFMSSRGEIMNYAVAWDQTGAMWRDYLDAAGAMGIPHAFVVDKQGRIAWQGHPGAGMERILDEIIGGTFDAGKEAERSAKSNQIMQLMPQYSMQARSGNWEAALAILNDIIKLDPTNQMALTEAYIVQHRQFRDSARARAWAERLVQNYADNPDAMMAIAETLLSAPMLEERMPDLALRAARGAFDTTQGKNSAALRVYALAAYSVGHLDEAIRLQSEAIAIASPAMKPALTTSLEYYQACKQLRDSQF